MKQINIKKTLSMIQSDFTIRYSQFLYNIRNILDKKQMFITKSNNKT